MARYHLAIRTSPPLRNGAARRPNGSQTPPTVTYGHSTISPPQPIILNTTTPPSCIAAWPDFLMILSTKKKRPSPRQHAHTPRDGGSKALVVAAARPDVCAKPPVSPQLKKGNLGLYQNKSSLTKAAPIFNSNPSRSSSRSGGYMPPSRLRRHCAL